jgi:predicted RNA-binding Zn ribbon-like protein
MLPPDSRFQAGARPEAPHSPVPMIWNEFPCFDLVDSQFADHTGGGRVFERLPLAGWQRAFLDHWGWTAPVPASRDELVLLGGLRGRLRRVLERAGEGLELRPVDVRYLNSVLGAAPFVYAMASGREVITLPRKRDWNTVAAALVRSAVEVVTASDPSRIKVCANADCSWMFYDQSTNRSRRWCQANICGNLVKVREHRSHRRT